MASITINYTPNTVGTHYIAYRDQAVGGAYTLTSEVIALNEVSIPRSLSIYVAALDIYCESAIYEGYIIANCQDPADVSPADGIPDSAVEFTVNIDPIEDPCKLYQFTYLNLTVNTTLDWDSLSCAGRSGAKIDDPAYDADLIPYNTQILCSTPTLVNEFLIANPDWSAAAITQTSKIPGDPDTGNCHCICYSNVDIENITGSDHNIHYVVWNPGNADHLQIKTEVLPAGTTINRDIISGTVRPTGALYVLNVTTISTC